MAESTHNNCEGLLGSLSDYIDGDLGAELCRQIEKHIAECEDCRICLLYTSPSPRDRTRSRMPSSA